MNEGKRLRNYTANMPVSTNWLLYSNRVGMTIILLVKKKGRLLGE